MTKMDSWFSRWREKRREREEKRSIGQIRRCMRFIGHDLDHISDEGIKERVVEIGRSTAEVGLTAQVAADSMRLLGETFKRASLSMEEMREAKNGREEI